MIRALLAGRKTQTRRIVRLPADAGAVHIDPGGTIFGPGPYLKVEATAPDRVADMHPRIRCPYGYPEHGDRLWVRETWRCFGGREYEYQRDRGQIIYRADPDATDGTWRPAIFMPRWASRITLEIVSVRVGRLHAITEEDARAEGVEFGEMQDAIINGEPGRVAFFNARDAFAYLWEAINGKRASWKSNPYAWVVSFKRIETP
jgi:hypothetical protein